MTIKARLERLERQMGTAKKSALPILRVSFAGTDEDGTGEDAGGFTLYPLPNGKGYRRIPPPPEGDTF
jgi:hypothetical protein